MKTNKNTDNVLRTFTNRLIDTKGLSEDEFNEYFGIDEEEVNQFTIKKKITNTKKNG